MNDKRQLLFILKQLLILWTLHCAQAKFPLGENKVKEKKENNKVNLPTYVLSLIIGNLSKTISYVDLAGLTLGLLIIANLTRNFFLAYINDTPSIPCILLSYYYF